MITWSLEALLNDMVPQNLDDKQEKEPKIPTHLNKMDIFGSSQGSSQSNDSNSILNINQFVTKNYFSRHQHSFFYSDERITD